MSDERARILSRQAGALKQERSTWEQHWQDIMDVMRPASPSFLAKETAQDGGKKRTNKMFDAVPPLALEKHAAVLEALLSPRNQVWSRVISSHEELQENVEVQRYLDALNKMLFRLRYRPSSNLASQLAESYLNLGSVGTQALYTGDDVGRGMFYRSCGMHNIVVDEDSRGRVNQVFRYYKLSAAQAVELFDWDRIPQTVKTAYENKRIDKFDFLQAVVPRAVVEDNRRDFMGMQYASVDIFLGDATTVEEKGYRVMPYAVSRYTKSSEELYGRSPAMLVLPGVNMANRMKKAVIEGAEKSVRPPLMTMDDSLAPFNMTPGAMNYGTLDEQGRETVKPFNSGARVDIGMDMLEAEHQTVREAFLLDVFQILQDSPKLTATQVLEMAKEKAALLSPIMGRQQSELFGPMTEREIDIIYNSSLAQMLPPMPDALIDAGGEITIEYQSPLALAQRSEAGVAMLRTWEQVLPFSQTPEGQAAMQVFNIRESVLELARINGYPAKALRSVEELDALEEQDRANQQAQQMIEAAPVVTQGLESLAKAQALGAGQA